MKRTVHILSLATLVMLMLLTLIPAQASEADLFIYELNERGEAVITGYTGAEEAVTIPLELNGNPVSQIGDSAFMANKTLQSVILPESVISIGKYSFMECSALKEITFSNSLTDIGQYAFADCDELTSVVLPQNLVRLGRDAFSSCDMLESAALPVMLSEIEGNPFAYCAKLARLTVPLNNAKFTLNSSVLMNRETNTLIFYPAVLAQTEFTIPAGTESIGDLAFAGCASCQSVILPDGVRRIGWGAFANCKALKSLILPDSLADIAESAFAYCNNLEQISISLDHPVFELTDEALIQKAKENTAARLITYVGSSGQNVYTVPETISVIDDFAFAGRGMLTEVIIPETVDHIGKNAFNKCSATLAVVRDSRAHRWAEDNDAPYRIIEPDSPVGEDSPSNDEFLYEVHEREYIAITGYTGSRTDITIPAQIDGMSVRTIGDRAFQELPLTSVTLPESVLNINNYAFFKCESLTKVILPNELQTIGWSAFSRCYALTDITLPKSVIGIGEYAFSYCTALTSINLTSSLTSISEYMFNHCDALEQVVVPEGITTIKRGAFINCVSLHSVSLSTSLSDISWDAFLKCSEGLTLTVTPGSYAENWAKTNDIPYEAYTAEASDSERLENDFTFVTDSRGAIVVNYIGHEANVMVPDTFGGTYVKEIARNAFFMSFTAESITLPEGLETICEHAFCYCPVLKDISIPESVVNIDTDAFVACGAELTLGVVNGSYAEDWAAEHDIPYHIIE